MYLYPFLKNVIDVPPDGLCAFSSIAVSLGQTPDQATTIRRELEQEILSRYEWYEKNIPNFCIDYNIKKILKILQNPKRTAGRALWLPMPGASTIIANTYQQPVLFYTNNLVATMLAFPSFSPPTSDIRPIILAHVNSNHFVSLDLSLEPTLPIPHLDPEWPLLHDKSADAWNGIYSSNVEIFKTLAKDIRTAQKIEWAKSRAGLPQPDAISMASTQEKEDDPNEEVVKKKGKDQSSSPPSTPPSLDV